MSTATLTSLDPAAVSRAVRDVDEYHSLRAGLKTDDEKRAFDAAVNAAYRTANPARPLSGIEKRILQFAGRRYPNPGSREQAIRDQFDGLSATRFYQLLNALIDRPEAAKAYPVLVNRLRGQRAAAQARRAGSAAPQGSTR